MAVKYVDLLNQVLRKLGEPEVTGNSTDLATVYHKLVGQFINDVKEEVEDATNWRSLRQILTVALGADELRATITEANERSRLVRIYQTERVGVQGEYPYGTVTPGGGYIPLVFDVTDASNPAPLKEMDLSEIIFRDQLSPDQRASSIPQYFALDNTSGDVLDLVIHPRPSDARSFQVTLVIPQPYLTDTQLQEVIKIPTRPVYIGAVWHAFEERGEELGPDSMFSEQRYRIALDAAVARDEAESGDLTELIVI